VLAALCGLVNTAQQLYWVRFFVGIAQAGFFPGCLRSCSACGVFLSDRPKCALGGWAHRGDGRPRTDAPLKRAIAALTGFDAIELISDSKGASPHALRPEMPGSAPVAVSQFVPIRRSNPCSLSETLLQPST
jgi:hypothetical protein